MAELVLAGRASGHKVAVSAGIKQRSHTPGALPAVVCHPILREVVARISPALGRPPCYVGDLAGAARQVVRVLAAVLGSFAFEAAAAALRLSARQTVVVNYADKGGGEVWREFEEVLGRHSCTVRRRAV